MRRSLPRGLGLWERLCSARLAPTDGDLCDRLPLPISLSHECESALRKLRSFRPQRMEEVSLPRACVAKAAKELAPAGLAVSKETCDLLVACCTEFINLVSSEANAVAKSVVKPEHIIHALRVLEFETYVPIAERAAAEAGKAPKRRKIARPAASGLSAEELVAEQARLIASARDWGVKHGVAAADARTMAD